MVLQHQGSARGSDGMPGYQVLGDGPMCHAGGDEGRNSGSHGNHRGPYQ